MKKLSSIFLILLTIYSCNNPKNNSLREKEPINEYFSNEFKTNVGGRNLEIIELDSISNFSTLRNEIANLICENKVPGITFKKHNNRYNLIGYSKCVSTGETKCEKASNLIYIKNDSIIKDLTTKEKVYISQLQGILIDIESGNYKYQITNDYKVPILIYLDIDDNKDISITKTVLKEISANLDHSNSDRYSRLNSYKILFTNYTIENISTTKP